MKILCIHGIGRQEAYPSSWQPYWTDAITDALGMPVPPVIEYLAYDDLFAGPIAALTYRDYARAFAKLAGGVFARDGVRFNFDDSAKWYVGMVAAWIDNKDLCYQLNQRLIEKIETFEPDVIVAHSLGSLIAYDTFAHFTSGKWADAIKGRVLVTLGSQVGNEFIRDSVFIGVNPLPTAKRWFHLWNPHDRVFTAPLDWASFRKAANFEQVDTTFGDILGPFAANHVAVNVNSPDNAYLTHPNTREMVWAKLASGVIS